MSKGRYFFGSIEGIDIARVACSSTEVIELFCVIMVSNRIVGVRVPAEHFFTYVTVLGWLKLYFILLRHVDFKTVFLVAFHHIVMHPWQLFHKRLSNTFWIWVAEYNNFFLVLFKFWSRDDTKTAWYMLLILCGRWFWIFVKTCTIGYCKTFEIKVHSK